EIGHDVVVDVVLETEAAREVVEVALVDAERIVAGQIVLVREDERRRPALRRDHIEVALPALELLLLVGEAAAEREVEPIRQRDRDLREQRPSVVIEEVLAVDLQQAAGERHVVGEISVLVEEISAYRPVEPPLFRSVEERNLAR